MLRKGRFYVAPCLLADNPRILSRIEAFLDLDVRAIRYVHTDDWYEVLAYSSHFRPIREGASVPLYNLMLSTTDDELSAVEATEIE